MSEIKEIFDLLEDKRISDLLYTIFVYGSKDGCYFRQSDLENLFSGPDTYGNDTVRRKLKLMENIFIKIKRNNKTEYHSCDGYPEIKEIGDSRQFIFKWTNKKTLKGNPIVPTFNWLEKLYNFKLTKEQEEKLKSYFQSFAYPIDKNDFNPDKFPGVKNTNLLEIFANSLELSYILRNLGQSFFGDNFENARSELRAERRNFTTGENYDKKFNAICDKYGVRLNKYNEGLITILSIFDFGITEDFPQIKHIVPAQNLRYEYGNPLLYTISDVLIMSFMDEESTQSYQYYNTLEKKTKKNKLLK